MRALNEGRAFSRTLQRGPCLSPCEQRCGAGQGSYTPPPPSSLPSWARIRVTAAGFLQENPYLMLKGNHQEMEGNARYEGFCVDMLEELAGILRFSYTIRLVGDGVYGVPEANGTWTGMVGELIARVRHAAAGAWERAGQAGEGRTVVLCAHGPSCAQSAVRSFSLSTLHKSGLSWQ